MAQCCSNTFNGNVMLLSFVKHMSGKDDRLSLSEFQRLSSEESVKEGRFHRFTSCVLSLTDSCMCTMDPHPTNINKQATHFGP